MKKRLWIGVLLVLLFATIANAVTPRAAAVVPILTFSNDQANCTVSIAAESSSQKVTATIKLWHGETCVKTWTTSGTGSLLFSKTAPATQGETYKLSVSYKLDGKAMPTVSVTNTYQ